MYKNFLIWLHYFIMIMYCSYSIIMSWKLKPLGKSCEYKTLFGRNIDSVEGVSTLSNLDMLLWRRKVWLNRKYSQECCFLWKINLKNFLRQNCFPPTKVSFSGGSCKNKKNCILLVTIMRWIYFTTNFDKIKLPSQNPLNNF